MQVQRERERECMIVAPNTPTSPDDRCLYIGSVCQALAHIRHAISRLWMKEELTDGEVCRPTEGKVS